MRKGIRLGLAGAAMTVALMATTATPAMASGYNSVLGTGNTAVSIYVNGSGTRVNYMEGGVVVPTATGNICDGRIVGGGTRTTGAAWSKTWGQYSGCIYASWSSRTTVNLDFRKGTNMTVRAYHDGFLNSGRPTLAIQ